jgi:hypothetical protein
MFKPRQVAIAELVPIFHLQAASSRENRTLEGEPFNVVISPPLQARHASVEGSDREAAHGIAVDVGVDEATVEATRMR